MNIGIIGTRKRDSQEDYDHTLSAFNSIIKQYIHVGQIKGVEDIKIVSGGCPKGGDRFAELIHTELDLKPEQLIIHLPEKPPIGSPKYMYVRSMHDRNDLIARDSDVLLAVTDHGSKKGGTLYTIKKFKDVTPMGTLKCYQI